MKRRRTDGRPPRGSLEGLRELNRLHVVDALRERGAASKADLAGATGLSRTTVTVVLGDLQRSGLVVERNDDDRAPPIQTRKGRRPARFALDAAAGAAIGVDLDHTHLRVAVADLSMNVLREREVTLDVDNQADETLDVAARMVEELLSDTGIPRDQLIGAGMGLPGPIDLQTGAVQSSVILPGWIGLKPAEELTTRLGLHVEVDNDANLGALGEAAVGAIRGLSEVVYVKVSGGIGAALVLDGHVYRGSTGRAGELGHIEVQPGGTLCRCGKRGCLESVASAPVLVDLLRAVHGGDLTLQDMLALIRSGDAGARRLAAEAGNTIGRVLGDICTMLDPEAVVIGGELAEAGQPFLDGIQEAIDWRAMTAGSRQIEVRPALLGKRAGVLGALALVIGDTQRIRSAGLVALYA